MLNFLCIYQSRKSIGCSAIPSDIQTSTSTVPFQYLEDINEIQFDAIETFFKTFEFKIYTGETQFNICEKRFGWCELRIDNYESQIVTLKNDFDNKKAQTVHFEFDVLTREPRTVTFVVQIAYFENQFAFFSYDIAFVSDLYICSTIHSDSIADSIASEASARQLQARITLLNCKPVVLAVCGNFKDKKSNTAKSKNLCVLGIIMLL